MRLDYPQERFAQSKIETLQASIRLKMAKSQYSSPSFQPSQIVCLEHGLIRLYAEVVQTAENRCICWVRPIALVESSISDRHPVHSPELIRVHSLRKDPDLLLPATLFRTALDTEVIPLLAELGHLDDNDTVYAVKSPQLSQLVEQICSAYPEAFHGDRTQATRNESGTGD